ncbi:zinc finger CCCH domain-containing protein 13 [Orussus abietinus]|uniref:zinc finger CCCH domain-containing protein 13 n=1 Tax=Orussus abietinus TaxID=222816 RepID=UPI000625E9DE|nr:zinc finger CCCH domain-containing protein 13 [Orussus abietinus]
MRETRWHLLALYGILLATAVSAALKNTRPKFKIATTSTTTTPAPSTAASGSSDAEGHDEGDAAVTTVSSETNATTGHTLTGIPQIDYIWDPNLPRELNGYNLSDYPFYNSIPEDIDFKCDGLHDGFYASVPHKCQVYHHCLYGTRYDFLCANFTAFDQKTFICHFVSEVDCINSKKYWHRNDALYKAATTTTTSTTTSSTSTTIAPSVAPPTRSPPRDRDRDSSRRRRPFRRRPAYDYYEEDYYDEEYDRDRPRGYDRREDYEYEDRKYRRDRDRDRDRDFREREPPRPLREREDRDRERFSSRANRRDPLRRDPPEDEPRSRGRDQDPKFRDPEEDLDDRWHSETRPRNSDKRYREEYEDKEPPIASAGVEGLVKPAAPSSSVYSRPRAPPKIRRPVPLSEQDRFAYKATSAQPVLDEPRRRPAEVPEDDYYEDEVDEVRPRRPMRRRPSYRERDFYERDRDRDRPFRPRYREEDEEARPRKYPERPRDRYHDRDRGRDRSLDRGKDRSPERSLDRERDHTLGRAQSTEKPEKSPRIQDREREPDRLRSSSRSKEPTDAAEHPKRPSIYDRTTERALESTSETQPVPVEHHGADTERTVERVAERPVERVVDRPVERPEKPIERPQERPVDRPERPLHSDRPGRPAQRPESHYPNRHTEEREEEEELPHPARDHQEEKIPRPTQHPESQVGNREEEYAHRQTPSGDEYSSEYYDDLAEEDPPAPPPRTAVRVVKRPFLPSRGGNPHPRGLSPVGTKAPGRGTATYKSEEEKSLGRVPAREPAKSDYLEEDPEEEVDPPRDSKNRPLDGKQLYDAYKVIQTDMQQKHRGEDAEQSGNRPAARRPLDLQSERAQEEEEVQQSETPGSGRGAPGQRRPEEEKPAAKWPSYMVEERQSEEDVQRSQGPRNSRPQATEPSLYSATFKTEEGPEQPSGPGSLKVKQRINEVTHPLQDIPESEYDVTLNDALTPTLNQETSLPSGFVLPLHRQLGRDPVLQSSENNYQVSQPLGQQQQQQHQQDKPFVPSPQFVPSGVGGDRSRTVYFRTPETIHIGGSQYRQQRGPWHDYTGY